jgi:hypothetical protein
MDVDSILQVTSKQVFSNLEDYHYLILKRIAKQGPQSARELEEFGFRYPASGNFDRWSLARRLEGSTHFIGFIPNDYVYKFEINKKESRYGLSIKGLMAILSRVKFEKIFYVKRYSQFLRHYVKETNKVEWMLNYIKHEIAYVLYYNYLQGLNWTKFHYLKSYLNEFKRLHKPMELFVDKNLLRDEQQIDFEEIKKEYLKFFYTIYLIFPDVSVSDENWKKVTGIMNTNKKINPKLEEQMIPYVLGRYWHDYLDLFELKIQKEKLIDDYVGLRFVKSQEHRKEEDEMNMGIKLALQFLHQQGYDLTELPKKLQNHR